MPCRPTSAAARATEASQCAGHLRASIDRYLLSANWINSNLAAKEQQITGLRREFEDSSILQEKLALLREKKLERGQIELLDVHVGVSEVGVARQVGHQIGTHSDLQVESTRQEPTCSRCESGGCGTTGNMPEVGQSVRFDDQ